MIYQSPKHQKIGPFNPKKWGLSVVCMRESFSKGSLFSCFPICAQASSSSLQVAYRRGHVQRRRHVLVRHHLVGEQRLVLPCTTQLRFEADFWRGRAGRLLCYSGLFKLTAGDERAYSSSTTANRSLGKQKYAVRYMRGCFSTDYSRFVRKLRNWSGYESF